MENGQESSSPSETFNACVHSNWCHRSHSSSQQHSFDNVSETTSLLSEQQPETTRTQPQTPGKAVIVTFVLGPLSALSVLAALLYLWTPAAQHLWASLATTTLLAR